MKDIYLLSSSTFNTSLRPGFQARNFLLSKTLLQVKVSQYVFSVHRRIQKQLDGRLVGCRADDRLADALLASPQLSCVCLQDHPRSHLQRSEAVHGDESEAL